ncbi:Bbp16 family capsid cement protein [Pseudomonas caricapapayae]|uniref:Bbp16 family capsid cement protein n=1 Tax=Pseudomonas caricapapayae TaxID=46678 RepID=A0ACC7LPJ4_9PSED
MLFDAKLLMSSAQAITASAASTDVIDRGDQKDVGKAGDIPLLVQVVEAFNTLTSLTIELQADDNSGFSSPRSLFTAVVPLADLKLGYQLPVITLPQKTERYLRMNYTVTGTAPTTGKITAGIVAGVQTNA